MMSERIEQVASSCGVEVFVVRDGEMEVIGVPWRLWGELVAGTEFHGHVVRCDDAKALVKLVEEGNGPLVLTTWARFAALFTASGAPLRHECRESAEGLPSRATIPSPVPSSSRDSA